MLLKQLLDKVIDELEEGGVNEEKMVHDIRVNGINMATLLPTPARQKSGLTTKCVHMFQSLYNSRSKANTQSALNAPVMARNDRSPSRKTKVLEIE